ncbi:hypothetical protein [Novipirellula rosea]|uniref:hypothetical protein n=1 Tax=Novipirellula rosea TaxID=1031540 RepID=UPI0031E65F08
MTTTIATGMKITAGSTVAGGAIWGGYFRSSPIKGALVGFQFGSGIGFAINKKESLKAGLMSAGLQVLVEYIKGNSLYDKGSQESIAIAFAEGVFDESWDQWTGKGLTLPGTGTYRHSMQGNASLLLGAMLPVLTFMRATLTGNGQPLTKKELAVTVLDAFLTFGFNANGLNWGKHFPRAVGRRLANVITEIRLLPPGTDFDTLVDETSDFLVEYAITPMQDFLVSTAGKFDYFIGEDE